jgi:putative ABC transport system ATP-binding protein
MLINRELPFTTNSLQAGNDITVLADEVSHSFSAEAGQDNRVLRGVNLAVRAGEVVILTGPSGAGKTTLLTLIGALRGVQAGFVRTLGENVGLLNDSAREKLRQRIGFIFQDHNLFEALTARQTLRLAMSLCRDRYKEADYEERPTAVLDSLGLAGYGTSLPGKLSTGQKQRVAIGRALINDPQLILADEPTASLDKESGRRVMDLLRRHADERGVTVIIVTHDGRLFGDADRILEMVDGRIVAQ